MSLYNQIHAIHFILLLLIPTLASAAEVSFKADLVPILARRCLGCHDHRKTEGRFALHTFEQMLKPGDSGDRPIVPGQPDGSDLFKKLIESDASVRMAQEDDPLSAADIALFKAWIEQGAKFDGLVVTDRIVTLLPARKHPRPPEVYRVPVPVFALRFSPDGHSIFTSGVHEVLVWDSATGKLQRRIPDMPQRIHSLRFSPNGQTLAVAGGAPGEYGEIRLVSLANGSVRVSPAWEDVVLDVAFNSDGRTLVAGGADHSVRAYSIESGQAVWRTQQHVDWVTAIAGPAAKFDISNPALSNAFTGQQDQLFALDVHAGTSRLAAAGFTGEVIVWPTDSDKPLDRFKASPMNEPPKR